MCRIPWSQSPARLARPRVKSQLTYFLKSPNSQPIASGHDVIHTHFLSGRECPRGVMVKAMDCGIVVSEFVLQSRYCVHFRANTLGKGMNPLILPAMALALNNLQRVDMPLNKETKPNLSGGFIMTFVIVISSACEREHLH